MTDDKNFQRPSAAPFYGHLVKVSCEQRSVSIRAMTGSRSGRKGSRRSRSKSSRSRSRRRPRSKTVPRPCSVETVSPEPPKPAETLLEKIVDFDKRFSSWMHKQGLGVFFYLFLRTLEFSGDGLFLIPAAAATFLAPKPKLTPELRMFFFNLFVAFMFDLLFVSIIKNFIKRPRPSYNRGHFMTVQVDHWSFPSGHSTRALMAVTFFTMYLPMWKDQSRRVWLPFLIEVFQKKAVVLDEAVPLLEELLISIIAWVVFTWAVATTTSRIILGRHFFFDVLVGSMVGISESVVYHCFLFIPQEVSEMIHSHINGVFASIEDGFWRLFHKKSFDIKESLKCR